MLIHGVLHLLGHDHQLERAAIEMERIEAEFIGTQALTTPIRLRYKRDYRIKADSDQGSNSDDGTFNEQRNARVGT